MEKSVTIIISMTYGSYFLSNMNQLRKLEANYLAKIVNADHYEIYRLIHCRYSPRLSAYMQFCPRVHSN